MECKPLVKVKNHILFDTEIVPLDFLGAIYLFRVPVGGYFQLYNHIIKSEFDTNMYMASAMPMPQEYIIENISLSAGDRIVPGRIDEYRNLDRIEIEFFYGGELHKTFLCSDLYYENKKFHLQIKSQYAFWIKVNFLGNLSDFKANLNTIQGNNGRNYFKLRIDLCGMLYKAEF